MPTNKPEDLVAAVKNVFANLIRPNMTFKSISELVLPRLDEIIAMHEKRGLKYAAGKFHVKYVDAKHFQLGFEMYFKDDAGKWHKCANEDENNDATFLREDTWKEITNRQVITFPIEKTKKQEVVAAQQEKSPLKKEDSLFNFPDDAKTWQEFEVRLKKFFANLPKELRKKGVANYAVRIFSLAIDNDLDVFCVVYYDKNGQCIMQIVGMAELEEATAPTWATKNLSVDDVDEFYERHIMDVTARYIKNLQVDAGILRLLDEYLTFYRCKSSLVSDDSLPLIEEVDAFLATTANISYLTLFLPKIWFSWQEFENCWRNFLVKMPLLMKVFDYDDYEDKIYSCIKDGNLRITYKICYKRNNRYLARVMRSESDENKIAENKINEINNLGEHWVTRIVSSEFNNFNEAPTWATKGLTEEEIDVTERYKKFFSPRTLRDLNGIPSPNELFAYLHDAKDWREFENSLKDFFGLIPFALRKMGVTDYAHKLFSTVEKNFLATISYVSFASYTTKRTANGSRKALSASLSHQTFRIGRQAICPKKKLTLPNFTRNIFCYNLKEVN